jgi:hypothetical protein
MPQQKTCWPKLDAAGDSVTANAAWLTKMFTGVAVDHAFCVGGVERVGNVNRQTEQNIGVDGLSGDAVLQRHPVQKLHGDVGLLATLADVVNSADVGVV